MLKTIKIATISILVVASLGIAFGAGCIIGNDNISSEDLGLGIVDQVWEIIWEEYVDRDKLDASTLSQGAIEGLVEALDDPYSSYLSPESFELSMGGISGKFEGIGAYVGMRDDKITIIAPITGSPAEDAGVKAGDIILEVEGESVDDMTLNEVVLLIRGPKGTKVEILVQHMDETEPVLLSIIRDEIKLSSVYYELMDDIAYVHISNFSERTNEELTPVFEEIEEDSAKGIVLDLRSNPGGLLDSVVDVTSRFVENGYVLFSEDNKGNRNSYAVTDSGKKTDLPMAILTDNFTASASEVISGALQDFDRAVVIGTVTYGKGSVNTLHTLKDGSGVYITTHRWLTPNGRLIEGKGITPDYEYIDDDIIQFAIDYLQDNRN
ncbi:MAG: S41 family peptidase [Dehalococcoidales bacterium]|nr:MAG: S41 family peptidase [Dehalococcoidales bacterium]